MAERSNLKKYTFNFVLLTFGTFAGRIVGYTREILIVKVYGVNEISDRINFLLLSPDLLNNLFSWSIIVSTVLPYLFNSNSFEIYNYVRRRILITAFVFYVVFVCYFHFISHPDFFAITIISSTIFLNIYFSFTLVVAQKHGNFVFTSLANLSYNVGVIFALFLSQADLILISVLILFSSIVRFVLSYLFNLYHKYILNFKGIGRIAEFSVSNVLLAIMSQTVLGLAFLIDKLYASDLGEGALTRYGLIEKLYLAPVSIITVSFLSTRYPDMIEILTDISSKKREYWALFRKYLIISFSLLFFLVLTVPIVRFLFVRFIGFEIREIEIIISHYRILLFDLLPFSVILFFVNHFLAQKKFILLLTIALFSIVTKYLMLLLVADSLMMIILSSLVNHVLVLLFIFTLLYVYEKSLFCYLRRRAFSYDWSYFKRI